MELFIDMYLFASHFYAFNASKKNKLFFSLLLWNFCELFTDLYKS